jgi:hypothetical protein
VSSPELAARAPATPTRRAAALAVARLGPATIASGLVWALLQPDRVTLLDPGGQGFWWLAVQPPLLVMLVGAVFHRLVAPGLLEDLRASDEEA